MHAQLARSEHAHARVLERACAWTGPRGPQCRRTSRVRRPSARRPLIRGSIHILSCAALSSKVISSRRSLEHGTMIQAVEHHLQVLPLWARPEAADGRALDPTSLAARPAP
jgi:hypothetical protein